MKIRPNVDLSGRNTLGAPSRAQWLAEVNDRADLPELVRWAKNRQMPVRVLGGGSNLLLDKVVSGLVLDLRMTGRQCLSTKTDDWQQWRFAAGENWHKVVEFTVEQELSGLENLALIPGSVGAAPIQNIGAYGAELADNLIAVEAFDTRDMTWVALSADECRFGYRDSVFKQEENRYVVTAIVLNLSRAFRPRLEYGPLQALKEQPGLSPADVMETVIAVRQAKLPDPVELPNAGSFFKNPIVTEKQHQSLKACWPELVAFPAGKDWKLAAGWLIDRCGLKGCSNEAGVGCYEKQALVVVNPRRAGFNSIAAWQTTVQRQVKDKFGVELEIEPRYWR